MDRPSRQKLNKEMMKLTEVINLMDLIDIYRIFYPNTKEYTFFAGPQ
jgi:exonuclease III